MASARMAAFRRVDSVQSYSLAVDFQGVAVNHRGGACDFASERSTHEQDNAEKESQAESSYADLQRQGEWPSHHRRDGA